MKEITLQEAQKFIKQWGIGSDNFICRNLKQFMNGDVGDDNSVELHKYHQQNLQKVVDAGLQVMQVQAELYKDTTNYIATHWNAKQITPEIGLQHWLKIQDINHQLKIIMETGEQGLAEELYNWMVVQKYGGEELLHAAVCCDYAGKRNFINSLQKIIDSYSLPVEAQVGDDFAGLYWKHRCEAAEIFIAKSPCDPDITEGQIKAYAYWKKLCDIKPKDYNK